MKGGIQESGGITAQDCGTPRNGSYIAESGMKIIMINGQPHFHVDEVNKLIVAQIEALPKETSPVVKSGQDARRVMDELLKGIGGDMERFQANIKLYLEDIRQTRFAVVTETSQMTGPLRELRQFFIGSEYKDEIIRLREFVELCERLQKLKESGFLDNVADTMLRLADRSK